MLPDVFREAKPVPATPWPREFGEVSATPPARMPGSGGCDDNEKVPPSPRSERFGSHFQRTTHNVACQAAGCLDWERNSRRNPGRCPDGAPWFPSEGVPPTSAPSWQEWPPQKRTKGARRGPSEIAPGQPADSFDGRFPETQRHRPAMRLYQNRRPGRNRFKAKG